MARSCGDRARQIVDLLSNDEKRIAMSRRAAAYGRDMVWPAVARRYLATFERAHAEQGVQRQTSFAAKTLASRPVDLPETNLEHVGLLTDGTGILQHAVFSIPRYDDGYCLDDNARALLLTALVEDAGGEDRKLVRSLASRYFAFVSYAFNAHRGRFRNFMSYTRRWTEEEGSEDSHGRALWALGTVVGRSIDPGRRSLSGDLFHAALPAVERFTSPRAWAFALIGIDEYLRAFEGDSGVQSMRESVSRRLFGLFQQTNGTDWPWFEDRVTYDSARLSQALISCGVARGDEAMLDAGLRSLDWLVSIQRTADGYFSPIGSNGFYARGGTKAAFDQQPLEAYAMVSACLEARRATGHGRWTEHARRAFGWFLGQNHLQHPLYDASTGGCRDGLHSERANENQGAESTLAFQLALLELRNVERAPPVRLLASVAR